MLTTLLAIDPGTKKCGYALFEGDVLQLAESVKGTNPARWARQFDIVTVLKSYLINIDVVVSEEPMMQGKASQAMHKFLGAMEYARGGEIKWVHPMTVRKHIAGYGKADKLEMALEAGRLLKTKEEKEIMANLIANEDFDATDAVAIGLYWIKKEKESN